MSSEKKRVRRRLLGIPPAEATFARRGFRQGNPEASSHLEEIGRTFLHGYNTALVEDETGALVQMLNRTAPEFRGFAFEGAAMALELLDRLTPWRKRRVQSLLAREGQAHVYMVHVGVGWAFARLPWLRRNIERSFGRYDHLLRWLIVDGFGFHEGFFNWRNSIRGGKKPTRLSGYGLRAFDQGLGRSIWFVEGADVTAIASTIAAFDRSRHRDLWGGVGLACTYAGGISVEEIERLKTAAGAYLPDMAQGATFAAKTRQKAGLVTAHTELACTRLCGMSVADAALLADDALRNLPDDGPTPAYEIWRRRIQAEYSREVKFA